MKYAGGAGLLGRGGMMSRIKAAKIAGDLTQTNANVISSVEETSRYKFLSKKDLFDVEYWSLEQAKLNKAKKELQGNVVVVTGSTGEIGKATYKLFKKYRAEVVLLDINKSKINDLQTKISDLCIHCDVTNKQSVKKAFSKILEIVSNSKSYYIVLLSAQKSTSMNVISEASCDSKYGTC